jgi:hypothetical protein
MSKILLSAALCGALAGGASYGLLHLTQGASTPVVAGDEGARLELAAAAPDEGWRAEFEKLRVENAMLAQRLNQIETGSGAARAALQTPETVLSSDEVSALKQLVQASAPSPASPGAAPVLYANVKGALEDIRAKEDAEREERRRQAEAERLERDLERMTTELALAPYQTEELRRVLTERNDLRAQVFEQMRDGSGDFEAMREQGRANIERLEGQIKASLSEEQFAGFQEKFGLMNFGGRNSGGFRGFGRTGGGGGGGGGGF